MKHVLVFFLICFWCLGASKALSQTKTGVIAKKPANAGNLNPDDYKYYFVTQANVLNGSPTFNYHFTPTDNYTYYLNWQIIDVRTGKVVMPFWAGGRTYWLKDRKKLLSWDNSSMLFSSLAGVNEFMLQTKFPDATKPYSYWGWGTLSPDFRQVLSYQNNDFHIADINLTAKKLTNVRQLTRFGFNDSKGIVWAWHGSGVGIGDRYWLNTKTGDVQEIAHPDGQNHIDSDRMNRRGNEDIYIAPGGRFAFLSTTSEPGGTNEYPLNLIDISTNRRLACVIPGSMGKEYGMSVFWLDSTRFLGGSRFLHQQNSDKIYLFDYSNPTQPLVTLLGESSGQSQETLLNIMPKENRIRPSISPDAQQFIMYKGWPPTWYIVHLPDLNQYVVDKQVSTLSWIDDDHILYTKTPSAMYDISVADKGTYLLNLKSGERKKLFSYVAGTGNLCFSDVNYFVFEANGQIWRCHLDGSELMSLTKIGNGIPTIASFLTKIIE